MPFTLVAKKEIPEFESVAALYRHDKTGARLLSIANGDENKVFGISFRTPPARSDGVAHIMEHSVLCGSKKYPVKEPFVELMKGSLNTFLNAMTYPDKTVYPVASTNLKDLRNLIDVYLDAVFNPRIGPDTFRQEGWHYEVDSKTGDLSYKGVVFNEMKGAYSDPDDMHDDLCRRSLFPDTTYGLDSGGDPERIPSLDYETFKEFHERYYHPSNSFIYFYGDDDPAERLALLDSWLEPYEERRVDSLPGWQKTFERPETVVARYDGAEPKAWVALNWALAGHEDTELSMGFSILSHILTATPASPLRKALIDSGLGEDLAGFGYEEGLRRSAWSVGLKGVNPAEVDAVEPLVLKTLEELASDGIDPDTVAASLNTFEFLLREKNTGRFPRGLAVMLDALNTWLYDGDVLEALTFIDPLEKIKRAVAAGEPYFENMIRTWFLSNLHRRTVALLPDEKEGARREEREKISLEAAAKAMSGAEKSEVEAAAARLRDLQERPDSPEALATIPSLGLEDLPKLASKIPSEKLSAAGSTLLFHDLSTSSILYFDAAFPLDGLEDRLMPYAGLLGRALFEMGTDTMDYVRVSQEIGKRTGGISTSVFASSKWGSKGAALRFLVRGKALAEKAEDLFSLMGDSLANAKLDNKERFKQIVLEEKAQTEASLVPAGHRIVGLRLKSRADEADRVSEMINGVEQLFFLRSLAERLESDWPGVLADLVSVRDAVLDPSRSVLNLTVDGKLLERTRPQIERFAAGLKGRARGSLASAGAPTPGEAARGSATSPRTPAPAMEFLLAPTQVNFVGTLYPLSALTPSEMGAFLVVKKYMDTTYLWEKVRVQGGAYGGFSAFDIYSNTLVFLSYRDPNLEKSLEAFDKVIGFLEKAKVPPEELLKATIGTIGDVDAYLLPDAKGFASLSQYLAGYSQDDRQAVRDGILSATPASFSAFAAKLAEARGGAISAALSSKSRVEALPPSLLDGAARTVVM